MLENIPEQIQLIILVVLLAVLYFAVIANNKRNKEKRFGRKSRDFRKNFYERRKEKEKDGRD